MGGYRVTTQQVIDTKELRQRNENLKQEEIAAIVGVDRSTVGRILKGKYDHMLEYVPEEVGTADIYKLLCNIEKLLDELVSNTVKRRDQSQEQLALDTSEC